MNESPGRISGPFSPSKDHEQVSAPPPTDYNTDHNPPEVIHCLGNKDCSSELSG